MQKDTDLTRSLSLLLKSSLIVLIGVILSKVFTYLYKIVIARSFDPEIYGLFNLSLMIVGVLITLVSFGLPEGILRFVSLDRKNRDLKESKYLLKLSLIMISISSLIFSIGLFFSADFISQTLFNKPGLASYLKIFSAIIPLTALTSLFLFLIRSFEDIKTYVAIQNILQNGARLFFLFLFLFLGLKIEAITGSYILGAITVFVVTIIFAKKYLLKITASTSLETDNRKKVKKAFFAYSQPIIFLGIVGSLFYWVDSFVISYYMTGSDIGYYNVAFTLVGLLGIAPELFMQLFFPMVVKEYSKNNIPLIKDISRKVVKWILILDIPVFVMLFFYPGAIINILFDSNYLVAESSLKILAIGGLISGIFVGLCTNLLSMKGKSKTLLINTIVITILNFIGNLILVPKYGLDGAAITTSISWLIFSILLLSQVKYNLGSSNINLSFIKIILISIPSILVLFVMKLYLPSSLIWNFLSGSTFLLIYGLSILLLGGLDKQDFALINNLFRKNLKSPIN